MEKEILKLIKKNRHHIRSMMCYELLGYFGDRLPKDIEKEIRATAVAEFNLYEKTRN